MLVLGGHVSGVTRLESLDEGRVATTTATLGELAVLGVVIDDVLVKVGTGLGGLKAEAVQDVDVGLGAVSLVVGVANGRDLLQTKFMAKLRLGLKNAVHFSEKMRRQWVDVVGVWICDVAKERSTVLREVMSRWVKDEEEGEIGGPGEEAVYVRRRAWPCGNEQVTQLRDRHLVLSSPGIAVSEMKRVDEELSCSSRGSSER